MKEKKKFNILRFLSFIILIILSITFIFILSTYLKWNNEMSEYKTVLVYYDNGPKYQDKDITYDVEEVKNFYEKEIPNFNITEGEYTYLYCHKVNKSSCYYLDNQFEVSLFVRPTKALLILGALIIFFFYLYIRQDEKYQGIFKYAFSTLIIATGLVSLSLLVIQMADYYSLINQKGDFITGEIVGKVYNRSQGNQYLPVVKYTIEDKDYYYLSDYVYLDKEQKEIIIYYDKDNYENATLKKNNIKIIELICSISITITGLLLLNVNKPKKG